MDDGLEVARTVTGPRASGVFPDERPEEFSVPEQRTDDDPAQ